ncbi:hypothetical protein [Lactiplantibacillus paraplantarum]|nr:hypothetical protein [Lactiplantibacillus paraplantarum]
MAKHIEASASRWVFSILITLLRLMAPIEVGERQQVGVHPVLVGPEKG